MVLAAAILGWPTATAQDVGSANPQAITDASRPLSEVARMLESAYSRPVTYEESILSWPGDIEVNPNIRTAKPELALVPKHRSFQLPFRVGGADAPALDAALVGRILDAYHVQNDGPKFRVANSSYGLHIVPALANDARGQARTGCIPARHDHHRSSRQAFSIGAFAGTLRCGQRWIGNENAMRAKHAVQSALRARWSRLSGRILSEPQCARAQRLPIRVGRDAGSGARGPDRPARTILYHHDLATPLQHGPQPRAGPAF